MVTPVTVALLVVLGFLSDGLYAVAAGSLAKWLRAKRRLVGYASGTVFIVLGVFLTLVDTHTAALISAAFLFQFGTGPIRGFAVALFFGLLSNLFTSIFVSKTLFEAELANRKVASISI